MKKGVVIFASNNEKINYVALAKLSANRVKQFLDLPVALITDSNDGLETEFDYVIDISDAKYDNVRKYRNGTHEAIDLNFKNQSRASVYDLSPFDETLVIDADYLIANDNLNYCWNQDEDFLIYKKSIDIAGFRDDSEFLKIDDYSIDFYWATVFFFRKTQETKILFDLISHIRDNWNYYRLMYNVVSKIYRNDYAFSIAVHILRGFKNSVWPMQLPGRLAYCLDKDFLISVDDSSFTFLVEKEKSQNQYTLYKTDGVSVHVMNKFSILKLIENV